MAAIYAVFPSFMLRKTWFIFKLVFILKVETKKKARKTKAAGACLSSKWYIQINIYLFTTIIETDSIVC